MSASKCEDRSGVDGFEMEIFKLVKEEATPERWKQWLRAPLEYAVAKGNSDLFTRLMDAGAGMEPGWRGCHGRTLLGVAVCSDSGKMVRAVLEAGATVEIDTLFGAKRESALHVAAARGAKDSCMALMVAGADPNLGNFDGDSPLHIAAEAGYHGVVGMLLMNGAPVDAKNGFRHTPLHLAAFYSHTQCIFELLLGGADKDADDGSGKTPLFRAVENNSLGAVETLLAAGAARGRLNNECSTTPLEEAANNGHATIVKAFLDTDGGEVDATDSRGFTALHYAADVDGPVQDNGEAVRVLLGAGAEVNAKASSDEHCYTPLHTAVQRRIASTGTIRALLEGGADVNACNEHDETPLHVACSWSSVAAVELLLLWGADEELEDEDEFTPEHVVGVFGLSGTNNEEIQAIQADHPRICQMLARAPADRSWRRRGWLVLSRAYPTRAQIANGSRGSISSSNSCSAKVARASGEDSCRDDEETDDQMTVEWRDLVGRVVGLEVDGLFRLVVSFL